MANSQISVSPPISIVPLSPPIAAPMPRGRKRRRRFRNLERWRSRRSASRSSRFASSHSRIFFVAREFQVSSRTHSLVRRLAPQRTSKPLHGHGFSHRSDRGLLHRRLRGSTAEHDAGRSLCLRRNWRPACNVNARNRRNSFEPYESIATLPTRSFCKPAIYPQYNGSYCENVHFITVQLSASTSLRPSCSVPISR